MFSEELIAKCVQFDGHPPTKDQIIELADHHIASLDEKLSKAIEQNYCTICGNILSDCDEKLRDKVQEIMKQKQAETESEEVARLRLACQFLWLESPRHMNMSFEKFIEDMGEILKYHAEQEEEKS
jgi:hypothetical protein